MNVSTGKKFFRSILEPCIHVEGPDGAGKTTLAKELARGISRTTRMIESEDPPKTRDECDRRILRRIPPGVVCDRSSGLVSELVYGPVLRGGTIGPEDDYWGLVKSILHAVVFVYCRPPTGVARKVPKFRDVEDPTHVRQVVENQSALVDQYDVVMGKICALGGQVIRYDWTRDKPEEVIRCVG